MTPNTPSEDEVTCPWCNATFATTRAFVVDHRDTCAERARQEAAIEALTAKPPPRDTSPAREV
jgi:hypothetical protein